MSHLRIFTIHSLMFANNLRMFASMVQSFFWQSTVLAGGYILYASARIVNLYEGILFLFREIWRPVAYSSSE